MKKVIEISNLSKKYGDLVAIDDISFEVYQGEIFALLGANGAGKTTTLECIEGLRKYDNGQITTDGSIGVQLQSSSLPNNMTVNETFTLHSKWNKREVDILLFNRFGLDKLKSKKYGVMSTGEKRRLHLALALINNPDIIILDEPTAGLDVEGRVSLHDEIRKLKEEGKTIVIASHDMAEVESLCDRIAILKNGSFAFLGTAGELTNNYMKNIDIHIKVSKSMDHSSFVNCEYKCVYQEYLVFQTKKIDEALLELLGYLKESNNEVLDLIIERPSLEDKFIEIARGGNVE
ncbi:MAG: ABC transporter ATP-binding protein [Clostridiales bacterium]|nr:ABC transporter ATP-binding protein [Clostridiales bacterium]